MLADLDLLSIAVFCAADDLLPGRTKNARRILTDVEVVTLCVRRRSWASALMRASSESRVGSWRTCFRSCRTVLDM